MIERVLVAVVAKYVCGNQSYRVFLRVVTKIDNQIFHYLVITICRLQWLQWLQAVSILTFGDGKGPGFNGCKVCIYVGN